MESPLEFFAGIFGQRDRRSNERIIGDARLEKDGQRHVGLDSDKARIPDI